MNLHKQNIIIGLLRNLLKKNNTAGKEYFTSLNENFFQIALDVSGFDQELIINSLEELSKNLRWLPIGNDHLLVADINRVEYDEDDEMVTFTMLNEKFIELRDSILKNR